MELKLPVEALPLAYSECDALKSDCHTFQFLLHVSASFVWVVEDEFDDVVNTFGHFFQTVLPTRFPFSLPFFAILTNLTGWFEIDVWRIESFPIGGQTSKAFGGRFWRRNARHSTLRRIELLNYWQLSTATNIYSNYVQQIRWEFPSPTSSGSYRTVYRQFTTCVTLIVIASRLPKSWMTFDFFFRSKFLMFDSTKWKLSSR